MTTVWFTTPSSSPAGRGRLRAAGVTGLTIESPRRARRRGAVSDRRPVTATENRRDRSHEFRLEAPR